MLDWHSIGVSSILPVIIFHFFQKKLWLKCDSTCPKPNQMTLCNLQNLWKSVPPQKSTLVFNPRSEEINILKIVRRVIKIFNYFFMLDKKWLQSSAIIRGYLGISETSAICFESLLPWPAAPTKLKIFTRIRKILKIKGVRESFSGARLNL